MLPSGATFNGNNSIRTFDWTPSFTQAGSYTVNFFITDNIGANDTQPIQINVSEFGNHAPSFTTVLADTVDVFVGVLSQRVIRSIDLDLDSIQLAMDIGPGGFIDSGNGNGVHIFQPTQFDIGLTYDVRYIATDIPAGLSDTLSTVYRVRDFLRGDADGTFGYNMNDIVYIARFMYRNGPAPNPLVAGDADSNGSVNIADAVFMINYLYRNGPKPQ